MCGSATFTTVLSTITIPEPSTVATPYPPACGGPHSQTAQIDHTILHTSQLRQCRYSSVPAVNPPARSGRLAKSPLTLTN
jgi:hypothetical protein